MKCFSFHYGDKKDDPKSMKSISGLSNCSAYGEGDLRRSDSEFNSQNVSDNSTDSLRRTSFPSLSQRNQSFIVMSKSQFYLSECTQAAEKSTMCFKLGAALVKGGKIISTGYNHHRTHYDSAKVDRLRHRKPTSMHAEMHAIFSFTGLSPSFKKQVQGFERRVPQRATGPPIPEYGPPIPKGCTSSEWRLSEEWCNEDSSEVEGVKETYEERKQRSPSQISWGYSQLVI